MSRLTPYLWISLGAVLGACARYLVNQVAGRWFGTSFPYGTLAVNLLGCVLVGLVATLVAGRLIHRPDIVHLVVVVGFLGSLTTFSAFALETHAMVRDGAWANAVANVVVSLAGGLAGVRLGIFLAPG